MIFFTKFANTNYKIITINLNHLLTNLTHKNHENFELQFCR